MIAIQFGVPWPGLRGNRSNLVGKSTELPPVVFVVDCLVSEAEFH